MMNSDKLTRAQEDSIYNSAFHWRFEDGMGWKFVTQLVNSDLKTEYDEKTIAKVCDKLAKGRKKKDLKDWFG